MANITGHIKDIVDEMTNKVTWPTLKELQESAIIVIIASAIFALIITLMDGGFSQLMKLIY